MKGGIAPIYGFPREMASRSDFPGRLARRVEVSPPLVRRRVLGRSSDWHYLLAGFRRDHFVITKSGPREAGCSIRGTGLIPRHRKKSLVTSELK